MQKTRPYILTILAALLCTMLYSCAVIGNPEGGARDEDPPRFVSANPMPGTTNVDRRRIEITFNELVNVKDAFKNVVVSPTSKQTPRVSTSGRKVIVNFQDTLLPNTTYTIDFGNSIEDINENNKLNGFAYWFSTGDEIDSLRISGMVLDAQTLEPQQGILVGAHLNLADSAFRTVPLLRVARTDDYGRFVLRNLAEGEYNLFALGDLNNDYIWDNPAEQIAFFPRTVTPWTENAYATDTIFNMQTGAVDTIVTRARTRYMPNDLLLTSFTTDFKPQYLVSKERTDSARIDLIFNFHTDSMPTLWLVDFPEATDWNMVSHNTGNDTIAVWLRPEYARLDTIRLATKYTRTTFGKPDEPVTDTLTLVKPKIKPAKPKKSRKPMSEQDSILASMKFLDISVQGNTHEVYDPLRITFNEPVESIRPEAFVLQQKVDTVWVDLPHPTALVPDSLNPTKYNIPYKWEYGGEYRLNIDSIAAVSLYGHHNRPSTTNFRIKAEEDYGNLFLHISGIPNGETAIVELLNSSDKPVGMTAVEGGYAAFNDLGPSTYYARLFIDRNGNGKWDAGDYLTLTQPEDMYYFPGKINVKKNWDVDQTWNINSTPVDKQKPDAIKKNKPPTPKNQKKQPQSNTDEDEDEFNGNRNIYNNNNGRNSNRSNNRGSGIRRPSMTL